MNKTVYQKNVRKQKREGKTTICCSICGEDNPDVIEIHHILGRNNSEQTVPLCKNCHSKVTYQQNKLARKARTAKATPQDKRRFMFVTMGGILKVISEQLLSFGFEGDFCE